MLHYGYAKRTEYLKWKIAWFGAGRKFRGEQRSFLMSENRRKESSMVRSRTSVLRGTEEYLGGESGSFYQRIFQKISAGIPKFTIKTGR